MPLEFQQVNNIDNPDLQIRQVFAKYLYGGQSFKRWHITGACHYKVGFAILVVAGPFPYPDPAGAMVNGLVNSKPLRRWMLAGLVFFFVVSVSLVFVFFCFLFVCFC